MKALVFERNVARFAASRLASMVAGSGKGVGIGPLRLTDVERPKLPGSQWRRVAPVLSGICGSDLATLDGASSRYFEDIVSFPFVPGHEIVGTLEDGGARVVIEPVLGCMARGIDPSCASCAAGHVGGCSNTAFGHLSPGLQIGYCTDTGGGWSSAGIVAHESQIHAVPDTLDDHEAVMVEPTACGVHAALGAGVSSGDTVVVLGAGTLGLVTLAALRSLTEPDVVIVGAKHPVQRSLAADLGADFVAGSEEVARLVRRRSRSFALSSTSSRQPKSEGVLVAASGRPANIGRLSGGADIVIDCVGSASSLEAALSVVRPRGRVVLVGMPGKVGVDLAPLWQREVTLVGAYAYGTEKLPATNGANGASGANGAIHDAKRRTFDIAMELVRSARLGRLVSARYPLERFEEAFAHAAGAGRRGAVKIVFDPKQRRDRQRGDRQRGGPHHRSEQ